MDSQTALPTISQILDEIAADQKPKKYNNTKFLEENPSIRVLHVRPNVRQFIQKDSIGNFGMTIAYRENKRTLDISTSICHRDDTFTKKIGTRYAVRQMLDARYTSIPMPKDRRPVEVLREMFVF